ncbi:MAG: nuclear transport factor 2 family protein [Cyclobacteriaceae bacterium]|jgi:ketosteroid isomerase-like protein|nr:nuclear transport factor 2 family protein [Cyclobacteriaceae bacterium]
MRLLFYVVISFMFLHCSQQSQNTESVITDLLYEQEEAWNNGDIKSFMKAYWVSDSLKFIGASGVTYGYNETYEGYQKRYPNRATMGKLKFEVVNFSMLSDDIVHLVGKWDLTREMGDIGGHFTLIWKKLDNKWLIISDHTSAR